MAFEDNPREVTYAFAAVSLCLFGFIAWKPQAWVSISPVKPCSDAKLAKVYRWITVVAICGVIVTALVA
jgi:hypothetical protein